jgi:hypothetical protein
MSQESDIRTGSIAEEEMDSGETFSFPPAERKVVTQSYDLSIQTLMEQWNGKLLIIPEIQREYIWDDGRASRLIESLLLNIPVPVLYFAETEDAKYEIIDGQQRVRSIVRFVSNEFGLISLNVLSDYRGMRFHELPEREQRFLKMRMVRAVIISHESHPTMKFEIFERLNSGSMSLNPQELRNSIYRGSFNKMLRQLVTDQRFRNILGTKHPRPRMLDEELLLRFFALEREYDKYRPPLKRFLNNFMSSVRHSDENAIAAFSDLFHKTIQRVSDALGVAAFRLVDASGNAQERTINRSLFDAQMLIFSWMNDGQGPIDANRLLANLAQLYQEPAFSELIRRSTGDRSRTRMRVRQLMEAITRAGVALTVPFELTD